MCILFCSAALRFSPSKRTRTSIPALKSSSQEILSSQADERKEGDRRDRLGGARSLASLDGHGKQKQQLSNRGLTVAGTTGGSLWDDLKDRNLGFDKVLRLNNLDYINRENMRVPVSTDHMTTRYETAQGHFVFTQMKAFKAETHIGRFNWYKSITIRYWRLFKCSTLLYDSHSFNLPKLFGLSNWRAPAGHYTQLWLF